MAFLYVWGKTETGTRRLTQIGSVVANSENESAALIDRLGMDPKGAHCYKAEGPAHITHLNVSGSLPHVSEMERQDADHRYERSQQLTKDAMALPVQSVVFGRCHIMVVLINGGCLKFTSPFDIDCRYIKPGEKL